VQEEIRQHHDDAVAAVNRHRMPKDAFPDLGFSYDFTKTGHELNPLFNRRMIAGLITSQATRLGA
jgi:hypothetical protein